MNSVLRFYFVENCTDQPSIIRNICIYCRAQSPNFLNHFRLRLNGNYLHHNAKKTVLDPFLDKILVFKLFYETEGTIFLGEKKNSYSSELFLVTGKFKSFTGQRKINTSKKIQITE